MFECGRLHLRTTHARLAGVRVAMAPSYAAAMARDIHPTASGGSETTPARVAPERHAQNSHTPGRRSPSPSHVPRTREPESETYILTLLTDKPLHERMTALRKKYFPQRLNKLEAHLTLFHALPGSRLDSDILPLIEHVAKTTRTFPVEAGKAFRLKRGCAISISKAKGGQQGQAVHEALLDPWRAAGFLSDQDSGPCRLHYTVMNKVDSEDEIQHALHEITDSWTPDQGTAEGLALWRYDRGFWKWQHNFPFEGR